MTVWATPTQTASLMSRTPGLDWSSASALAFDPIQTVAVTATGNGPGCACWPSTTWLTVGRLCPAVENRGAILFANQAIAIFSDTEKTSMSNMTRWHILEGLPSNLEAVTLLTP